MSEDTTYKDFLRKKIPEPELALPSDRQIAIVAPRAVTTLLQRNIQEYAKMFPNEPGADSILVNTLPQLESLATNLPASDRVIVIDPAIAPNPEEVRTFLKNLKNNKIPHFYPETPVIFFSHQDKSDVEKKFPGYPVVEHTYRKDKPLPMEKLAEAITQAASKPGA